MNTLHNLTQKVLDGSHITKSEAIYLYNQPLDELSANANIIRNHFCSNTFDICTIINGKSGKCSEDCKFCSQSIHNHSTIVSYPLLSCTQIVSQADTNYRQGAIRFSIVTSGRNLSDIEIEQICQTVRQIKNDVGISVCGSFGLLNAKQYDQLKKAGITRIHNNLETSPNYFPNICTSHSFEDKIASIQAAQSVGLSVCSGGIMGIGETLEDRIDMAICLRDLGIQSVPINLLNPLSGTPLEKNKILSTEEFQRIIALYRFLLPTTFIRLAGGRGLLQDKGESCFLSGANATISGNMLTTTGISIPTDMELIHKLGYEVLHYDD